MKKILSLMLAFTLMAGMLSAVSVEAYSEWTTVYDKCYTDSSQFNTAAVTSPVTNKSVSFYPGAATSGNTRMFFTLAGSFNDQSDLDAAKNVYSPESTVSLVNKSDVPDGATENLSDKVVKFEQNVNACMFRLQQSLDLLKDETVRVTFKMYLDDIALKSGYTTADGAVVPLVEDTENTVKTLEIRVLGQGGNNGTSNVKPTNVTQDIPVKKWVTVSEIIKLEGAATGIRMDFGSNASAENISGYTKSFAQTIYFDGNIKVEKLTENTGRAEGNRWITASDIGFDDKANGYDAFSMNGSSSAYKVSDIFDAKTIAEGDMLRISAEVRSTEAATVRIMYGADSTEPLPVEAPTYAGASLTDESIKLADTVTLDANKWTKIGFIVPVTAEVAAMTPGIVIDTADYTGILQIDNIKTEVYATHGDAANNSVPTNLNYTEDFDTYNSYNAYNAVNATVIGERRLRQFGGNGTASIDKSTGSVKAYSGKGMVALTGRTTHDSGVKINDIFNGKLSTSDIGKTYRISVMVYPEKPVGAAGDFTVCRLALGGPDANQYKYRTGNAFDIKKSLPFNTWSEMYIDFTVTEDYLDNGSTTSGNPLISSLRIDQEGAANGACDAVCTDLYVDELSVTELSKTDVPEIAAVSCWYSTAKDGTDGDTLNYTVMTEKTGNTAEKSAIVIVAVYDGEGNMEYVKKFDSDFDVAAGVKLHTGSFASSLVNDGTSSVVAFIWDSLGNLVPYQLPVTANVIK